MKVVMQGSNSIAANTTNNNVLTGQKYERPPGSAIGALYLAGSALGLTAELNVGGNAVSDTLTVSAQNRLPVVPDDLAIDEWEAPEGELIQLKIANTTAGALTIFWRVELYEVYDEME